MGEIAINPLHNVHKKYRKMNLVNPYMFGSGFDADAQAFITAATITDTTQKTAVNQLVLDLKANSLWTKMKAIYPIVGGTAFTHKWNLKDPRDLDAAFRIVFVGTITHSVNGMAGNGTTGQCPTKLIPSTVLTTDNHHLSVYSRTNSDIVKIDIGAYQGSGDIYYGIWSKSSNTFTGDMPGNSSTGRYAKPTTSSLGLLLGSRISNTSSSVYRNSTNLGTYTTARTLALPNTNVQIMGSGSYVSNRQYAFATIGDGLNDTEVSNLYTVIQAYQTTLGRQV